MAKENQYDDPAFFDAYSQFPRSVDGLKAAGEWPTLQRMLPDFRGKRALDIGCGFGWHCFYAAEQGASYVLGTDISAKMLAVAEEKLAAWRKGRPDAGTVAFQRLAMEDLDFPQGSFDVVLSSLALHYTPDLGALFRRIASFLTPGASLVFSMEHPVFTAYGSQDWFRDDAGGILHWPVDRYFDAGPRRAVFLGETVVKYHRTLEDIFAALFDAGFAVTCVAEPQPPADLLDSVPGMAEELRRPMMLIVSAVNGGAAR